MSNRTLAHPTRCPHCGGSLAAEPVAPVAPVAPARTVGSFKGYDDFHAALAIAQDAAAAAFGQRWRSVRAARELARLPVAWTRCKVFGRVASSPRDVMLPAARFWPRGRLPVGPEYVGEAPPYVPGRLHREAASRLTCERLGALRLANLALSDAARDHWLAEAERLQGAIMGELDYASRAEAKAAGRPAPVFQPDLTLIPVAPAEPVAEPVAAAPEPVAGAAEAVWWQAVAAWRAYQSPDDAAAWDRLKAAVKALSAALLEPSIEPHMIRAIRAGRGFPAHWFNRSEAT